MDWRKVLVYITSRVGAQLPLRTETLQPATP
jgi:hypothetical protein